MSEQQIHTEVLPNGLTVVMEKMPAVQSAAFTMLLPAGSIYDPEGQFGTASLVADMLTRGAGSRDSRQLSSDLDNLGLQRSEAAGTSHITLSGATLVDKLPEVLRIYGDIVLRPHLPEDQFEAAREGALQSLYALEDEPRQKIFSELKQRCVPKPWGRPSEGTIEGVQSLTNATIEEHWKRNFRSNNAILGIAGNIDFDQIHGIVEEVFGDWKPQDAPPLIPEDVGPKWDHIEHDSAQTHIGIGYDSITYSDPLYYAAWASVSILSGGMSSRLFTEVREKRGLCYSIHATHSSMKQLARVLCYAGTTNERAQETLD
ncbi:MAG: peptidase M16, partial [Planctomyces sp.]|nr:peptidase M16 [Planctomyces sp.]